MTGRLLSIETPIHGRVLVRDVPQPTAVVAGFHGYVETAEIQLDRLAAIPGADRWQLVSIQGLHRFYRGRSSDVVASWMTREDRETMIADNVEYCRRVFAAVCLPGVPLVAAGFSQGVAMAFRSAVRAQPPAAAIIAVGGDVPPELLADNDIVFPPTLLMRGEQDEWYTASRASADADALRRRGVPVELAVHAGGHDWTPEVSAGAGSFIAQRLRRPGASA